MTCLEVPKVGDFEVSGDGGADAWNAAQWQALVRVGGEGTYETKTKVVYSETGIYVLVDCEDTKLTATLTKDFDDLYREDVVEAFFHPLEGQLVYFEYEISPLGPELPILVSNANGSFHGWMPWHYQGERRCRKATAVRGGEKASMANVEGWSAEFFIPFTLLKGLGNVPPESGSTWRANIYRIDYDLAKPTQWAWCAETGGNFHNYDAFGTLKFT